MRGIIFLKLKHFVETKFGIPAWKGLLESGGVANKTYLPGDNYDDAELVALVGAAVTATGLPAPAIIEDFGVFIAPSLLGMYKHLLKPEWRTLDVIEHTENTIHQVVRVNQPGAKPPVLSVKRVRGNEVIIDYRSQRKLCFLAVGIAKGMAQEYKENVEVTQSSCMHNGASNCLISVKLK